MAPAPSRLTTARGYLLPALVAAATLAILEVLGPAGAWPYWPPAGRVASALLLAALGTLAAPPGGRGRVGGFLLFLTVLGSVLEQGEALGLHAAWERWLLGLVLAAPFFVLFAAGSPGGLWPRRGERPR